MSAYAPGLKEGTPVVAGQYLARVGAVVVLRVALSQPLPVV